MFIFLSNSDGTRGGSIWAFWFGDRSDFALVDVSDQFLVADIHAVCNGVDIMKSSCVVRAKCTYVELWIDLKTLC